MKVQGRPVFVAVVGWSGSGKTSLVKLALEECARRGIAAAAAKRAHHEPDVSVTGKDSTAFLEAGAFASLYLGERGAALFMPSPASTDRDYYERLFPEAVLVFLEGDRVEGCLVVEAAGPARSEAELKRPFADIDLLATADPDLARAALAAGVQVLDPNDASTLIELAEARHGT